jgi:hypothetical protein
MHGALLAAQMLAVCWIGRLTSFELGFPLDDAWIHQVVARTFADTGVFGYTADRLGSAATSLSWAALMSVNHAWLHVNPAELAFGINAVLYLATGQLLLAMLVFDGAADAVAFGSAAFAATAANFAWFALSGMESMLLVFLSTLTIWLWTEPGKRPRSRAWAAGIGLALVFLTRPEAAALLGVLVVVFPWTKRPWRDLAAVSVPPLVTVAIYGVVMATATGDARPSTLEGRRAIWFQEAPAASQLELVQEMLSVWLDRLAEHTLASPGWPFWIALGLSLGGGYVVLKRGWIRFGTVVLWGVAHLLVYMVLFPTPGHGGRYQPLTPALFMGLAWVALYTLTIAVASLLRSPRMARSLILTSFALLMGLTTARSLSAWSRAHRDAVQHIWDTEVKMGRAVAELPESAVVASFDIGGIGFFAEREIIDLGALVDPSVAVALRESDAWSILDARNVTHVVVPEGYVHDFPDPWNFYYRLGLHQQGERLEPILRLQSSRGLWKQGIEATLHAAPAQVLYRVEAVR